MIDHEAVKAAYERRRDRKPLVTFEPAMQQRIKKVERFQAGAIISHARTVRAPHRMPMRPAPLRRVRAS